MNILNKADVSFLAKSSNEAFARGVISSFLIPIDPTVADLSDIKTAVSEAVTNAIIHAYKVSTGMVWLSVKLYEDYRLVVRIKDKGCGIDDIEKAMTPLYSTGGDEQAGIGFAVMESFCDKIRVTSAPNKGTSVTLTKLLSPKV